MSFGAAVQTLDESQRNRFHIFNSFFHKKLTEKMRDKEDRAASIKGMLSWTRNIDIFSKQAIFVPIHNNLHWSLAVILNPGKLRSTDKDQQQIILHLDSLGPMGHGTRSVGDSLRNFLRTAWEAKFLDERKTENQEKTLDKPKPVEQPYQWGRKECPIVRAQV